MSVFLLITSTLRTDPFAMTNIVTAASIFESIIVAFLVAVISQISFLLFIRSWMAGEECTHSAMGSNLLHKPTHWIPGILIALGYISAVSFGLSDVTDGLPKVMTELNVEVPEIILDRFFLHSLSAVVFAFLLCSLRLVGVFDGSHL